MVLQIKYLKTSVKADKEYKITIKSPNVFRFRLIIVNLITDDIW